MEKLKIIKVWEQHNLSNIVHKKIGSKLKFVYSDNDTLSVIFQDNNVCVTILYINKDHQTSMHCHSRKKTSLIVLYEFWMWLDYLTL